MQRNQGMLTINHKLAETQAKLVLLSIELERQVEEGENKSQTIEDYRQKAIDMEEHHAQELDELKHFFESTMKEQAVS